MYSEKESPYFFDEEKKIFVKNCLGCGANFVIGKGATCVLPCPERKREIKHREILIKLVKFCLPQLWSKITIEFLYHLPAQVLISKGWGWTDDIKRIITIPWWTLRNKKEFLYTIIHELAHISAYREKFDEGKRKILEKISFLKEVKEKSRDEYDFEKFVTANRDIRKTIMKNKELFKSYCKWEGHDYLHWHLEYLKLHQKIIGTVYVEYFYGYTKPRSHGFNEKGEGKYDVSKFNKH